MQPSVQPARTRARSTDKRIRVGDRVTFEAEVLRVLAGDERPLLIMVKANGAKLTINSRWFENGDALKGSNPVSLAGVVTRVGESFSDDLTPISIAVDGYTVTRVTLGRKWVKRA